MMISDRLVVHPVVKEEAPEEIRALLEDTQDTMGTPWPAALWRVYAMYPEVMRLFWERLKPAVATQPFLLEALDIAERARGDVVKWYQPSSTIDILEGERSRIQWELDAFEYGNPQLLIQQEALNRMLVGRVAGREGPEVPRQQVSQYRIPEIDMIEEVAAPREIREIYQDIRETLGLPLVNSDYLAMAKWPEFLKAAWSDIKIWRRRAEYRDLVRQITLMGQMAVDRMSPPVEIHQQEVRDALENPGQFENLRGIMEMFSYLLPGLIANVALLRVATLGGESLTPLKPEGVPVPS